MFAAVAAPARLTPARLTPARPLAVLALLFLPTAALAQDAGSHSGHMMSHDMTAPAGADEAPSTLAFKAAHETMMQDMAIDYTGDADVDFVRGMIPHHQAAIDAAKVVLEYGKDPENQALARAIIKAQTEEIAGMQAWLKKRGY